MPHLLITDDEPTIRELLAEIAVGEGYTVAVAANIRQARIEIERQRPDMVLLDMMLPKRSGFLVLEKIKTLQNPPRVVMVTANEGKRHQQYAEALGVDGYLLKPARLERLITLSRDLLGA